MTYCLIWQGEKIEEEISDMEEARYLQREYTLAYGGSVVIRRER